MGEYCPVPSHDISGLPPDRPYESLHLYTDFSPSATFELTIVAFSTIGGGEHSKKFSNHISVIGNHCFKLSAWVILCLTSYGLVI